MVRGVGLAGVFHVTTCLILLHTRKFTVSHLATLCPHKDTYDLSDGGICNSERHPHSSDSHH